MKTIDCSTFGVLIENHEPVDLIDVRPRTEFAAMHIRGARSLPLAELSRLHLFRRVSPMPHGVYVISNDRGSASLAVGMLHASSDIDAVVIEGGMKAWVEKGLPVRREGIGLNLPRCLRASAALLALAGIGLATSHPFIASLILLTATALVLTVQMLEKTASSETAIRQSRESESAWVGVSSPENAAAC